MKNFDTITLTVNRLSVIVSPFARTGEDDFRGDSHFLRGFLVFVFAIIVRWVSSTGKHVITTHLPFSRCMRC